MIDLFSGTPGSGKSLHAASVIKAFLGMGRPVICNFDIARDRCRGSGEFVYVPNDQLTVDFLQSYALRYWQGRTIREDTILLVIDECQLLFNAREWAKVGRDKWLSFFTQHRKYGYHIILVAQFDRMIDRQIRSLIEYEYVHRKVSNFGIWGRVFSLFALGKLFVAVKVWYPLHEKVGSDFFCARKGLYSIYDTYLTLSSASPGARAPQDGGLQGAPPCGVPARKGKISLYEKVVAFFCRVLQRVYGALGICRAEK